MSGILKIWTDLSAMTTDAEVLGYWENRQSRVLENLNTANSDFETVVKIIYRLVKSLNNQEKYSSIYYLYQAGYQPVERKLSQSNDLSELKYELGRGLHHNRKYEYSKRLFNELASEGFDTSRIDAWWDQTSYASIRDKLWVKTGVFPAFGRFILFMVYIIIVVKTREFLISTTIFIIVFELYEAWWYQYRVSNYLKDFEDNPELKGIKKSIKKKIIIEFAISLLFYPIYFLNANLLLPLAVVIGVYFQVFHYGMHYFYLPKLIGNLNRKKALYPRGATKSD